MLATRYWAEEEVLPTGASANPKLASMVATIICAVATLLVAVLMGRIARGRR